MIWHESSGPEVAEFAKRCEVALLPVGCVEMHGPHNPTGCDTFRADRVCRLAAELEPCMVLPPIFYNINDQMKCYPGTISIPGRMVTEMHRAIFAECARNGFKRIVVYVAHGGGDEAVVAAQAEMLEEATSGARIDYQVFRVDSWALPGLDEPEETRRVMGGHGGANETSEVWEAAPGMVHVSRVEGEEGPYLRPVASPASYRVDWIRNVPKGFQGRPELASRERGEKLNRRRAEQLAEVIRKIKAYDLSSDP
jgi:creatinine amidohydrolase/Fe(II)-dependent formamide hydrolase-like protein